MIAFSKCCKSFQPGSFSPFLSALRLIGGGHRLAPPSCFQPLTLHMIGPPPSAAATRSASSHKPRQSAATFPIQTSRRSSGSLLRTLRATYGTQLTSRYVMKSVSSLFFFLPLTRCLFPLSRGTHSCYEHLAVCAAGSKSSFRGIIVLSLQPASRPLSVLGLIKRLSLLL